MVAMAVGEQEKDNKQDIDRVIHSMVGIEYKSCSETWKAVKERIAEDEERFITELRGSLLSHNVN